MTNVYFIAFNPSAKGADINLAAKNLLNEFINKENIQLENEIPLKVHFGEKGNVTYVKPENYDGIIDLLHEKQIKTSFIECNVMYGGKRCNKTLHLKTAEEHGFTRIPVIIADGEHGEDYHEVEINQKHFSTCMLGKEYQKYTQFIVLAHFKGHMLTGFGGAIKQLAMGFASKGGKMAQHMGIKPRIKSSKCEKCGLCVKRCSADAITIGDISYIDHEKCVGCGACVSICPNKAVKIFTIKSLLSFVGIGNPFQEKVVEYAYAAQKGKKNIYMNFLMSITSGCDCEPRKMKPVIDDIGILISEDPLAIDQASCDFARRNGKKFRGRRVLEYAEEIKLGSRKYNLITIPSVA
jgi:uncharacterized protein